MLNTYSSTLTSKGQSTIPSPIREFLNLKPGQRVIYEKRGDEVVLINQTKLVNELYGSLKPVVKVKYTDKLANEAIGKFLAEEYLKTLPKKYRPSLNEIA